jgi:low temperature requirement protein LtrA
MGIRLPEGESAADRGHRWVVPPRLRTVEDGGEERHATWLELFFDLVFVVAIAQLSHELVVDHSADGFLRFAGLFVPVWVAWQGFSFYADRFDTDDLVFRSSYLAAMIAIAALAVLIPDVAHGESTAWFALSYVTLRSIMLALYARAWLAVPEARPLVRFYGSGYALGVLVWLASLTVDTPLRYVLWGVGLAVDLSLPPLAMRLHVRVPTTAAHVVERWGLFTIVVLGESVVLVALGTAGAEWDGDSVVAALLAALAVAGVWWLYFDRHASIVLRGGTPAVVVYSYAHLPLLLGLGGAAAGVALVLGDAAADHLAAGPSAAYLGGFALFLVSLVVMRVATTVAGGRRVGVSLKLGAAAVLLLALVLRDVLPTLVLAAVPGALLATLVFLERTLFPSHPSS